MSSADQATLQLDWIETPVGLLRALASANALEALEFVATASSQVARSTGSAILDQTRRELEEYFAAARRRFTIPIHLHGTPFQESVWKALCHIEYGQTVSYLEQSRMVGDEKAIRAVAQANGQNPIVIIVPCHRVINADGKLGGYGGGLLRKQFLLDLERGDRLL